MPATVFSSKLPATMPYRSTHLQCSQKKGCRLWLRPARKAFLDGLQRHVITHAIHVGQLLGLDAERRGQRSCDFLLRCWRLQRSLAA